MSVDEEAAVAIRHFAVLVLGPPGATRANAELAVTPLLAPYDMNLQVEAHEVRCDCVGERAEQAVLKAVMTAERRAEAAALGKGYKDLAAEVERESLGELNGLADPLLAIDAIEDPNKRQGLERRKDELDDAWTRIEAELISRGSAVMERHPEADQPDPDCGDCDGTGRRLTRENPRGKWKEWVIGGIWAGALQPGYDPAHDVRNYSACTSCDSVTHKVYVRTEMRPDAPPDADAVNKDGMNEVTVRCDRDHPHAKLADCNRCHGTGTSRNQHDAPVDCDAIALAQISPLEWLGACVRECIQVIVTPDGAWYQRQETLGSATVDQDTRWVERVAPLISTMPDAVAIIVDCAA